LFEKIAILNSKKDTGYESTTSGYVGGFDEGQTRRAPDKPGTGVVFVTPIKGPKQSGAAGAAEFKKTKSLHTVRIEGPDKRGQGARLAQALADKGLNLRGMSAAAIGKKFVCHIALDTKANAGKAMKILKGL